jgi:MarR family transcriptional regulator, 2-MHQ and catechol-resistance regulon repressor
MPKYQGSKEQVLALNTFIKLMRCANTVSAGVHCHLLGKLTVSQFGILEALFHLGPMSQKALAEKILKSPGNITTIINNLDKNGLVIRVISEVDKRYCTIQLTSKGENLIKKVFPLHADIIVQHMAVLNENEQLALGKLLKKLAISNN